MAFVTEFLAEAAKILEQLDAAAVDRLVELLVATRGRGGRLFILGVGGSAANASHAVNDFRKIAGMEAYTPADNVSELTARTNDDGWSTVFEAWLRTSRLRSDDAVLVFSVGGGSEEKNVSPNIVAALKFAKSVGARIGGIVGRAGGYTAAVADVCVIIPVVNPANITPHTEAFQAVVWHLLVSDPRLKAGANKVGVRSTVSCAAVFLDRDGVLNRPVVREGKPHPPSSLAEFEILPDAAPLLRTLKELGLLLPRCHQPA